MTFECHVLDGSRRRNAIESEGFPGQSTPFAEDREHHAYDAAAVRRWWNAMAWSASVYERFATEFAGK
jgi:hypothetical protein